MAEVNFSPDQLDKLIVSIAEEFQNSENVTLDDTALQAILDRSDKLRRSELSVDPDRVREALYGLLKLASQMTPPTFPPSTPAIDGSLLRLALKEYDCHYLWWC